MKKIAGLVMAVIVATMGVPPVAAGAPGVGTAVEQLSEADWIIMRNRTEGKIYFGLGWRFVSEGGLVALGAVGKGTCEAEQTRHFRLIMCEASGRAKELGPEDFEFDPALRSASMTVESNGHKNKVTWNGRGRVPQVGGEAYGGDGFVGAGAGMARGARANGQILGRKMTKKTGMSSAFLMQGAGAMVLADYGRTLTVHPDGSFDYRVEMRVPR